MSFSENMNGSSKRGKRKAHISYQDNRDDAEGFNKRRMELDKETDEDIDSDSNSEESDLNSKDSDYSYSDSNSVDRDSNEEDEEYEVDKIVDKRIKNGREEYRVKWKYWPASSNTWEGLDHLENCKEKLEEYNNRPARPEPSRPGPARPEPARPRTSRPRAARSGPPRPQHAQSQPSRPEPSRPGPAANRSLPSDNTNNRKNIPPGYYQKVFLHAEFLRTDKTEDPQITQIGCTALHGGKTFFQAVTPKCLPKILLKQL